MTRLTPNSLSRLTLLGLLILNFSNLSLGNVTCNFSEHFCGWSPFVKSGAWERVNGSVDLTTTNGIRPPHEDGWMAYVISSEDSWAELLSTELITFAPSRLSFDLLQTRYDFGTHIAQAQLLLSVANGTVTSLLWDLQAAVKWTKVEIVLPIIDKGRLLFRFGVGFNRQIAALSNITLHIETLATEPTAAHAEKLKEALHANDTSLGADNFLVDRQVSCSFSKHLCGWTEDHTFSAPSWNRTESIGQPYLKDKELRAAENTSDPHFLESRGNDPNSYAEGSLRSVAFVNDRPRNLTFLYTKRGESQKKLCLTLHMKRTPSAHWLNDTETEFWNNSATFNYTDMSDENDTVSYTRQIWRGTVKDGHKKWTKASVMLNETGTITLVFKCNANLYTFCAVDNIVLEDEDMTKASINASISLRQGSGWGEFARSVVDRLFGGSTLTQPQDIVVLFLFTTNYNEGRIAATKKPRGAPGKLETNMTLSDIYVDTFIEF
ncbi:hypothetical protein BV898_02425 [Hypsibius exemplaris]|uniref:MAM domain-containing protein n=1 Tax=Hypsibius exemplaris TaxID=2072580 RepID=A0A1W0X840_HYPEX|nr:hypothetical protein BV898_02425 [Hypsibius exemplaris]